MIITHSSYEECVVFLLSVYFFYHYQIKLWMLFGIKKSLSPEYDSKLLTSAADFLLNIYNQGEEGL